MELHCHVTHHCLSSERNRESSRRVTLERELLISNKSKDFSELNEFVIMKMNQDILTNTVKSDYLIKSYGNFVMQGKGHFKNQNISEKMRLMAQFLTKLRLSQEAYKDKSFDFFLDPGHWPLMLTVVKEMGRWRPTRISGEAEPTFQRCSIPLKVGFGLTNIFGLALSKSVMDKDYQKKRNIKELMWIHKRYWGHMINSSAL